MLGRRIAPVTPFLVATLDVHLNAGQFGTAQAAVATVPLILAVGMAVVVQIVGIADEGDARVVGMAHGEETGKVRRMILAIARTRLHVGQPAYHIFLLQTDVDDVALRPEVFLAQPFVLLRLFVVDGDVLHRVGRQVLKQQFAVALEEGLAVQQEVVDELAVVIDAPVALHLHARNLAQQFVQYRALGQLEGIGIVHDGVPFIIESHARGRDGHLLHHHGLLLQVEGRQFAGQFAPADVLQGVVDVGGLIPVERDAEDVLRRHCRNGEGELRPLPRSPDVAAVAPGGRERMNEGAVLAEQVNGGAEQLVVGSRVVDRSVQFQYARLAVAVVLDNDAAVPGLYLHGLPLRHTGHGIRDAEVTYSHTDGQRVQFARDALNVILARGSSQLGQRLGQRRVTEVERDGLAKG